MIRQLFPHLKLTFLISAIIFSLAYMGNDEQLLNNSIIKGMEGQTADDNVAVWGQNEFEFRSLELDNNDSYRFSNDIFINPAIQNVVEGGAIDSSLQI